MFGVNDEGGVGIWAEAFSSSDVDLSVHNSRSIKSKWKPCFFSDVQNRKGMIDKIMFESFFNNGDLVQCRQHKTEVLYNGDVFNPF